MTNLRSTIVNAGWLVSDRIVRLALNFIAGVLIARALGPTEFGLLNYGQALIFLVTPLATVGLPEIIVRELSQRKALESLDERQTIVASAMAIRAVSAILAITVMYILAAVSSPDDIVAKLVIIAYSLSILPQGLDVIESALQAQGHFKVVSIARTINSTIFAIIRIFSVFLYADVIWFTILYTIEIFVFGLVYLIISNHYNIFPKIYLVNKIVVKNLIKHSFPIMLRLFTIAVYMRIDQIMVKEFLGSKQLGIYSTATRITELWYFIPTALMSAALPRLTRSFELGMDVYERELRHWLRIMLAIAVPMTILISLGAPFIIKVLFGEAYMAAAPILIVQAWAGLFVAIGVASSPWFINTGLTRYGLYQAAIGAIASLVLNSILIPTYGLVGASISMVISYGLSAVLCNGLFRETRPLLKQQFKAITMR